MRLATRLILNVGSIVVLAMAIYIVVSHQQRQGLMREQLVRETDNLATTLKVVSEDALRASDLSTLDQALVVALQDEEIAAAVMLDSEGRPLAGGAEELACLVRHLPLRLATAGGEAGGWAACQERIYWHAAAVPPAALMVVAQREILLSRSVAAALRRQLLLTLALMTVATLAIAGVLHQAVSRPLDHVLRGLESAGRTGRLPRLELPPSAAEVRVLAEKFNEMAEQIESHREQLLHEAEERVVLERRLREAEQFAMIGRLSGGLAHELGSPLTTISMRAEVLRAVPDLPAMAGRQAEAISRAAGHISEVIHGLLHMARRQGIVFDPIELVQLIREMEEEIRTYAEPDEVQLEVSLPAAPVRVLGQEVLLRHALRNLVRNAVHALRRQPGERRLLIGLEADTHEARLLVEDTGPGIAPDDLEQVFDPFFSTKPAGEGLGLGLPITQAIIEEHGGELTLENVAQGGVRALILLPVPPPEAERERSEQAEVSGVPSANPSASER